MEEMKSSAGSEAERNDLCTSLKVSHFAWFVNNTLKTRFQSTMTVTLDELL